MVIKETFQAGSEKLAGIKVVSHESDTPQVLFLHGAGHSTKERWLPLAEKLLEHGIASFAFDFSGHGESSGNLKESSLEKRIAEAEVAFHIAGRPTMLSGASMGGYVALALATRHEVKNLGLFCPAMYTDKSLSVPFSENFSDIIRKENSWKNSSLYSDLRSFAGNIFICIGDRDEIIPQGVIDLLEENAISVKRLEKIIVPNTPHSLLSHLQEDRSSLEKVAETIIKFIKD